MFYYFSNNISHYITFADAVKLCQYYIALHCPNVLLHYIALSYITLHYITLRYITLRYITLHLHYIGQCVYIVPQRAANAQASAPLSLPIQCHSRLTRSQIENATDLVPRTQSDRCSIDCTGKWRNAFDWHFQITT